MAFRSVVDAESAMAVARSSRSAAATPRSGAEIRAAFLSFYEERGHKVMASASLEHMEHLVKQPIIVFL